MGPEDLIGSMIPLLFITMLGIEAVHARRTWPEVPHWRAKGFAFFVMLMTLNAVLPGLLPADLAAHSLLDGRRLGVAGGAVVGFLALTLATALLHRSYHHVDTLWRWVHQLHHSPPRLDVAGSVLFTPQEVVLNVMVFQLVEVGVLGIDPVAAAIVGTLAAFYGMFQHFNIRTPQWLGYVIQRPESHGLHHERGVHAYNYADFPLWDMLMGTFRNPRDHRGEVGFDDAAASRLVPMLLGRDANAPLYGPASRGSRHPQENPA
jgi:sterol desaturase/sphingolipid hydroxylase (fatty acid hydroxylase superfamily)